jgi:hypothetical protein
MARRATERPHHARSVSISRSTCMASARSDSSPASLSASARIAALAFRRAASMRAVRTAADTGVPSLAKTSSSANTALSCARQKLTLWAIILSVPQGAAMFSAAIIPGGRTRMVEDNRVLSGGAGSAK